MRGRHWSRDPIISTSRHVSRCFCPLSQEQCSSRSPLFRQKRPGRRQWHKGAFNSSVISFWSEIQYFLTAAAPFRTRSASLLLPELSAPFLDRGRLECVHRIGKESTSTYVPVQNADEFDAHLNLSSEKNGCNFGSRKRSPSSFAKKGKGSPRKRMVVTMFCTRTYNCLISIRNFSTPK